jgi:anthranilate synthase component 1
VAGNQVEILDSGTPGWQQEVRDPFRCFQEFMGRYRPVSLPEMPRFFGGAVGYLGYDTVRHFERLPETARRVLDVWDMYLVVPESLLIFDNIQHTIRIVSCCYLPSYSGIREAYAKTVEKNQAIIQKLRDPFHLRPASAPARAGLRITSNMSRNEYLQAVRSAKRYVRKGDIIQAVLSQRLQVQESVDPFSLYRALRRVNPSPYMFFLQYPKYAVVGSSPEVLVRVETPSVEVRPIAGTRPRGRDAREDKKRMSQLQKDAKEIAEHIMLVDLGRNDVGRVSAPGTVRVEELMGIEK